MTEFHETGYGRRFFDGQLPALIRVLERIAAVLEGKIGEHEVKDCPVCAGKLPDGTSQTYVRSDGVTRVPASLLEHLGVTGRGVGVVFLRDFRDAGPTVVLMTDDVFMKSIGAVEEADDES